MSCTECDNHERYVKDAEEALAQAAIELKRLDKMTYSEVYAFEMKALPLKQRLRQAKTSATRHRNKCTEAP